MHLVNSNEQFGTGLTLLPFILMQKTKKSKEKQNMAVTCSCTFSEDLQT